jgi:AraC-like DNA-binding protein
MRLQAEIKGDSSLVAAVEFHAKYLDDFGDNFNPVHHSDKIKGQSLSPRTHYDELIGVDSTAPYEIFWDLSSVPDQDGRTFRIWPVAVFKNNRKVLGKFLDHVVIDRKPEIPEQQYNCLFYSKKITVDGNTREWPDLKAIKVLVGKDSITGSFAWNRKGLFGILKVIDEGIYFPQDTLEDGTIIKKRETSAYWHDCIILMFDPKYNRSQRMDEDDFPLLISPFGEWYNQGHLGHNKKRTDSLGGKSRIASTVNGTVNNPGDKDTGYTVEFFLPWILFGIEPSDSTVIGFDLGLTDRDGQGLFKNVASWAGLVKRNRCNPTEWGRLVLVKEKSPRSLMAIFLIVVICVIVLVLLFKRKPAREEQPGKTETIHPLVVEADKIIQENLTNPDLNINFIAEKVKTKSGYLGKLYKNRTKVAILDKINELRIEKAEKLLAQGEMNVTQAGFSVGFNSPQYFIKVFKQIKGQTPKQASK